MDIHSEIQGLEEELASLERLQKRLPAEVYEENRADLEQRLRQLREQAGSAPVPPGVSRAQAVPQSRQVSVDSDASGNVIITGDGNSVTLAPDEAPAHLLQYYLRALADECGRLPLGLLKEEFAHPGAAERVSLSSVYTDLDVVSPPRAEEARGGDFRAFGLRLEMGAGGERAALLEAVGQAKTRYTALVGSPGSGKTTFVNYVAASLALGQDAALPERLRGLLPVRLELRRAALSVPLDARCGEAGMLWEALAAEIARLVGRPAAELLLPYVQRRLQTRGGLVLLDGLDEAPEAGRRRRCLLEAVDAWRRALPRCRFLLTARPYAYADPEWQLPNFEILALAPFNERQVQNFVQRWYQAVYPVMQWTADEAGRRAEELLAALETRPDLNDLASRPLLLTLMTTLHSYKSRMPEDRAELYEFSVGLLLSRWQMGRQEKDAQGKWTVDPGIERSLGLGEQRLRSALEELALQTHIRQGAGPERGNEAHPSADIPLGEVIAVFSKHAPVDLNPAVLLEYLENRAGLLVGRGNDVYTFPHRSFQEYLAACRLANTERDLAASLVTRLQADLDWWREIFLLAAGKKRQGGRGDAVDLVNRLVPGSPQDLPEAGDLPWRLAMLGGEAALDLRLQEFAGESDYFQVVLRRLRAWLRAILEERRLPLRERLHAGDVLGRLGDPRPGVATFLAGSAERRVELPDIDWVRIPAGRFTMGSSKEDQEAYPDERPQHALELPDFWIARCPLTNAQFRPFVEGGGYDQERHWTPEGWAWRQGAEPDFTPIETFRDKDYVEKYKAWVLSRVDRGCPYWWGHPRWGAPNRPVVGVSWYEALAFAGWLKETAQLAGSQGGAGLDAGEPGRRAWAGLAQGALEIRLPSEAEWEKAARGGQGRRWAWGDDWQDDLANTEKAGLGETSPVGMFPPGAHDLYDMTGNVWEWTLSKWGKEVGRPDYGYPYRGGDGRERLEGSDFRVVRGGSWDSYVGFARCAYRLRAIPSSFDSSVGFRWVMSLAPSGS